MKKQILFVAALFFAATALLTTGCKKSDSDTNKPVISVVGSNPYYFQVSTTSANYVDPSATASDDVDGSISVTASNSVVSGTTGTYYVTYTAKDKAGNSATAVRTVYVVDINGLFSNIKDTTLTTSTPPLPATTYYSDNLTLNTDGSGKVTVAKFGNYSSGNVYFKMNSPTSLTVPSQNVTCGSPSALRNFVGSGTISTTSPTVVVINFTEVTNGTTVTTQDTYKRN